MPNSRILLGSDLHGGWGVFSTLPGIDAETADPADTKAWSFRSDWARVENLAQVGKVTGLRPISSGGGVRVTFPDLGYVPFITLQYIASGSTNTQDDPWSKGSSVEVSYFSTYQLTPGRTSFDVGFPLGSSDTATAPAAPGSFYYFIWKIPTWVF